MDAISTLMLPMAHACGGMGMCGFCRISVLEGSDRLSEPGPAELRILGEIGARDNERLACFARVHGDVVVTAGYW